MECEELEIRLDSYSCTMRGDIQRFQDGYFNMATQFDRDDQGAPTAISGVASAYNGYCMWIPDGASFGATFEDGTATFEYVLYGSDLCDGETFSFQGVWDHEAETLTIDGVVDPAG